MTYTTRPSNIDEIYEEWRNFRYKDAEKAIVSNQKDLGIEYESKHISYLAYIQKDADDIDWENYIAKNKENYNMISDEDISKYLESFDIKATYFTNLNSRFLAALFEDIYYSESTFNPDNNCANTVTMAYRNYLNSKNELGRSNASNL